ncbi:hypothetical protein DSO57_1031372 [Entomophthora muscae]|uniref:Uncharacterized protein n=1 Tax=Entomophthora muscae TaxID=34485 RepID=A0ACC2T0J3_9FUNG|nr:hypothetical protein DSO57_1031372 [Entomophthora muscae]
MYLRTSKSIMRLRGYIGSSCRMYTSPKESGTKNEASKSKVKSPLEDSPDWDCEAATVSETCIRADKESGDDVGSMERKTIQYLNEKRKHEEK